MANAEQKDAVQVARALLGSISGQELPPQVEMLPQQPPPPSVAAGQAQVPPPANPALPPHPANLEVKVDPVVPDPAAPAPQGAVPGAQSNPPLTGHRLLLSRLVRALPIASESQLQAMLDVFDPRAAPPAAQYPNPPQREQPLPRPQAHVPRPAAPLANPGGIPRIGIPTNDPLQHLLPQHSLKRSDLIICPPPLFLSRPLPVVFVQVLHLTCRLCPGHTHNAGAQSRRFRKDSHGTQVFSNFVSRLHSRHRTHTRFVKSEFKLARTLQVTTQSPSHLLNCETILLTTIFSRRWASSLSRTQQGSTAYH